MYIIIIYDKETNINNGSQIYKEKSITEKFMRTKISMLISIYIVKAKGKTNLYQKYDICHCFQTHHLHGLR